MNDDAISELLAKVPSEIRDATEPLNSDLCWAAFILLLDHDDGLKIGEIEHQLGTPRSETLHVIEIYWDDGFYYLQAFYDPNLLRRGN